MRFPREFRRPIKFALLRSAPIFVAEKDRPREDDLFDRSSHANACGVALSTRELRFLRMYRLESAHTREKKALAELR